MADPFYIQIIESGVSKWNEWRRIHPRELPDLKNYDFSNLGVLDDPYDAYLVSIDLRKTNLEGANLSDVELSFAQFGGANLKKANLVGAKANNANFSSSDMKYADLSYANLNGCNICKADLTGATLNSSALKGASLYGSCLDEAIFTNVDLSQTRGLHCSEFERPPIMDGLTLEKTQAGLALYPYLRLDLEEYFRNSEKMIETTK